MTQISKATFNTTWADSAGTFADNTSRLISEGDVRQFAEDIKDSCLFVLDTNITTVRAKVTISTGSVLTSNATPVTLVAAQGAGTVIQLISAYLFLDYNTVTYATNTDVSIICNGYTLGTVTAFLAGGSDTYGSITPISANSNLNQVNQDVKFRTDVGNPTAGNSPVYVYITYQVITL